MPTFTIGKRRLIFLCDASGTQQEIDCCDGSKLIVVKKRLRSLCPPESGGGGSPYSLNCPTGCDFTYQNVNLTVLCEPDEIEYEDINCGQQCEYLIVIANINGITDDDFDIYLNGTLIGSHAGTIVNPPNPFEPQTGSCQYTFFSTNPDLVDDDYMDSSCTSFFGPIKYTYGGFFNKNLFIDNAIDGTPNELMMDCTAINNYDNYGAVAVYKVCKIAGNWEFNLSYLFDYYSSSTTGTDINDNFGDETYNFFWIP